VYKTLDMLGNPRKLDAIPNFKLDKPREKGVIGVLADFVKCDSKFIPIKKFLLVKMGDLE